jgi:myo-inositol-1-phosphate synthase
MGKGTIKVAICGVGNCASALIQGIEYYRHNPAVQDGLMHKNLGGYLPEDIKIVAAFDIDLRKVGRPLEEAALALPNCVYPIWPSLPNYGVVVQMGPIGDGLATHMKDFHLSELFYLLTWNR